jgi:hypothetical protein
MVLSPIRIRAMHLMAWETLGFDEQAARISLDITTSPWPAGDDPESNPDEDDHSLIDNVDRDFLECAHTPSDRSGSVIT